MRTIFLILLIGLSINTIYSQYHEKDLIKSNEFDEKGDSYFERAEYVKAIVFYDKSFKKDPSKIYPLIRKAEAYSKLKMFKQAEQFYSIVLDIEPNINREYVLEYGKILLKNKKLDAAKYWLTRYKRIIDNEIKGSNYISSIEKLYKDSTIYILKNLEALNSSSSEIGALRYKNNIIFASNRSNANGGQAKGDYDLFTTTITSKKEYGRVSELNSELKSGEGEGPIAYSGDGALAFLTKKYAVQGKPQSQTIEMHKASVPDQLNASFDFTQIQPEGFKGSIAQAALNFEGNTVFFTSNITGGNGGFDLYKTYFVDGKWTAPENLGTKINSTGNELYPFLHSDSVLYFSSDKENGKFDIYRVVLGAVNAVPEKMPSPINSKHNDFGLWIDENGQDSYLSSDRPGGKGGDDIYQLDILEIKIKYAGYKPRRNIDDKSVINLLLSNGKEYEVKLAPDGTLPFSFEPGEDYKLILQKENYTVEELMTTEGQTLAIRKEQLNNLRAKNKAEMLLSSGVRYNFMPGNKSIPSSYYSDLETLSKKYQAGVGDKIDIMAIAKELKLEKGEAYSIQLVKATESKKIVESYLEIGGRKLNIYGESIFAVLPINKEGNFNLQTDLESVRKNFSANKHTLYVDKGEFFEEIPVDKNSIKMLVNADSLKQVKGDRYVRAKHVSVIPGTEYILTVGKKGATADQDLEVIVPLTKGVKYNLGTADIEDEKLNKELDAFLASREGVVPANGEVIDISLLWKELDIKEGESLSFILKPVKDILKKQGGNTNEKSRLYLDDRMLMLGRNDIYTIIIPYNVNEKVNIQTDLTYLQENFVAESYTLSLDTLKFFSEITVDTSGYSDLVDSGWLVSVSVNTEELKEVDQDHQLTAAELSIIPGKMYILTVTKIDPTTGEESEIIVPLTKEVKYDFTSNPQPEVEYKKSLEKFLADKESLKTVEGELIDISVLSKELQIQEGDDISFSLLPVKDLFSKDKSSEEPKSSLYLDDQVVEFTEIQKYTINVPLSNQGTMNIATDLGYIEENFEKDAYTLSVDTISFFSEIWVDTSGYSDRIAPEDPVFDVVTINFGVNKFELTAADKEKIKMEVMKKMVDNKNIYVKLKGFADNRGDATYNYNLSKKRAQSAKAYMIQNGVAPKRIRTFSFGETQEAQDGIVDEEVHRRNRRVEITMYLPE